MGGPHWRGHRNRWAGRPLCGDPEAPATGALLRLPFLVHSGLAPRLFWSTCRYYLHSSTLSLCRLLQTSPRQGHLYRRAYLGLSYGLLHRCCCHFQCEIFPAPLPPPEITAWY